MCVCVCIIMMLASYESERDDAASERETDVILFFLLYYTIYYVQVLCATERVECTRQLRRTDGRIIERRGGEKTTHEAVSTTVAATAGRRPLVCVRATEVAPSRCGPRRRRRYRAQVGGAWTSDAIFPFNPHLVPVGSQRSAADRPTGHDDDE